MHTSARSAFLHCSRITSLTSRTAVYGPVRTVVWQGSAGDCRPYADQVGVALLCRDLEKPSPVDATAVLRPSGIPGNHRGVQLELQALRGDLTHLTTARRPIPAAGALWERKVAEDSQYRVK